MINPLWETRLLDIAGAETIEQLKSVRESEQNRLAAKLLSSASPADEVIEELNRLHDALIARVLKLAENDLARSGFSAPPVPYTYILYGSAGRYEQTLYSDQDSGLVYAEAANESEEESNRSYFARLSQVMVESLIELGYPPCEGEVIASNSNWRMSIQEWECKIDAWFAEPSWENVRYLLIVADGRAIAGDHELAQRLQNRFFGDMLGTPVIAGRMMENTIRHKVLVGVFGQLLVERYGENAGSLDMKYGAYIPMVNACRLLAIQAGIRETSTLKRIDALNRSDVLTDEEANDAKQAFIVFLRWRLITTCSPDNGELQGTGKIRVDQLPKEAIGQLKQALKAGKQMQRRVQRELQRRFGGR
ncbi:hypothetical protein D7Z26_13170 [Cohnella endophytica]|uniref:Signal transduction protein n=1 Tax=Cohnella endophytica TaxID=2419778 RepID=A0A494XUR9_9BACL|nr:DUF294 nucleotidyltransferase-like domain-containing protein [Cohnella endophytica]RKP54308.1 hypothetical protein D7Z26_13170 [Cohnella endophytica]